MFNILVIKSSAAGAMSTSGALVDKAVAGFVAGRQDVTIVERDLDAHPIAALTSVTMAGIGRPGPETAEAEAVRRLSDALIGEVAEADVVIIGAPMYNFSIPATLKTWFDHIIRAGVTFTFTPTGPIGLIETKPFLVVQTRGGIYSEGPYVVADAQEPLFRAMLRFIGMTDVHFVRAEGMVLRGREVVMEEASRHIEAIVMGLRPPPVEAING